MAKNGNLTSDLREAISKISEVGRMLAPLTSRTFEELSTSSHEAPQVDRPTVNSEVSNPQSIAPSRDGNYERRRLFATPRCSNKQASPSIVKKIQTSEFTPRNLIPLEFFLKIDLNSSQFLLRNVLWSRDVHRQQPEINIFRFIAVAAIKQGKPNKV